MAKKINGDISLYEISENYSVLLPVLVKNGIEIADSKVKLSTVGKIMKLSTVLKAAKLDETSFVEMLNKTLDQDFSGADITLKEQRKTGDIKAVGLLPCPVRLPLLEGFEKFKETFESEAGKTVSADLRAASGGAGFLEETINNAKTSADLPEIVLSAGYELFFGNKNIKKFINEGAFQDITKDEVNESFKNIDLKDPRGNYSVISGVPAVFMVNLNELGDRKIPESWGDILTDEFELSVSLPVGDFDLFNAILVTIFKVYGEEGIRKLGKVMRDPSHPAVSMKSKDKAAVTVIPYFFSKMAAMANDLKIVWPTDGAVLSPIFMLVKENDKDVKTFAEFFASGGVAEILSHRGLFPSTCTDIDNRLPKGADFMWPGWDFIYSHDISELIEYTEGIFKAASTEGVKL